MRHKVRLGFPGPGGLFGALRGLMTATKWKHDVVITNSDTAHGNFNVLWAEALDLAEAGEITHFAMLHSDTIPEPGWLDVLLGELDAAGVALVSAAIAIKDGRGLASCGIGDPADPWRPLRRFTFKELQGFPETFGAAHVGYPGGMLLHNNGCWVADLRRKEWYAEDENGDLVAYFEFPHRIRRGPDGKRRALGESEDWYFSRQMHKLGIPSRITRKVVIAHRGQMDFPNHTAWGAYEHDEDLRDKWDRPS
jgi:hypothetical protein